jgi:hypothetical protein
MASFAVGRSGCRAELPQVRVAVIRNQGETMLSPSNDVVPFLEAQGGERWAVTAFDERDFGGALGAAADFDVIVLGYNATLYTPELRAALRAAPPTAPVLLMHQREQHCFAFLRDELELEVVELDGGVREAVIPRERTESFEPLLSWPNAQLTKEKRLAVKSIRGLSFSPDGAWRLVMEAQRGAQRLPVLVRTRSDHRRRIVACSLLLRPAAEPEHGRLLENLLVYCAFGWPDVGLVEVSDDTGSSDRVRDLALGMAMWTERCVRLTVPSATVMPINAWPLRGVKRIVAPEEVRPEAVDGLDGAPAWFRRGGELIQVGADGEIAVKARLTDRFIVLREWAMWFGRLPEREWLDRLSPARAVLRMLDDVARADPSKLPEDVRFKVSPTEYSAEVAALIRSRVRHRNNVDETISATAAALDLDRLTGERALSSLKRRQLRGWLEDQLDFAGRSEQLDILRCLADAELLERWLETWNDDWGTTDPRHRVDALVATRLREAVHACWPQGDEPQELLEAAVEALDGEQIVEDLRHGPLLCADFVSALYSRSPDHPGAASDVFDPERFPSSVAAALDRVRAGGLYTSTLDVRSVCAHTQAIFRHVERHPAGLRFLADRGEVPSTVAESVLQEATKARHNEREARRDLPALGKAVLVLGTLTLALAAVGLLDLWRVSGVTVSIRPWWLVAPAVAVPACALAALRWIVLKRSERLERRDLRLAQNAMGVAALALALVAGTFAWRVGAPDGGVTTLALTLAPLAGTTAFALLLAALRRFDLAPEWAFGLAGVIGDIKSPLASLTKRLTERRSGRTSPPS